MSEPDDTIIWMRPEKKPARGKAPAYRRADIAAAAVAIADADGLDAVTMRRVAGEIGAGTMSLYRYVRSKDELHALMVDALMAPSPEDAEWAGGQDLAGFLRAMATSARQLVLDHPWFPAASAGIKTPGPNMLRGMDISMGVLDRPGLDVDEVFQILLSVMIFAQGYAQHELAELAAGITPGPVEETIADDSAEQRYVLAMMNSGEYPYLTKVITQARTPHRDAQAQFDAMLDWLLRGIESLVQSRTAEADNKAR